MQLHGLFNFFVVLIDVLALKQKGLEESMNFDENCRTFHKLGSFYAPWKRFDSSQTVRLAVVWRKVYQFDKW